MIFVLYIWNTIYQKVALSIVLNFPDFLDKKYMLKRCIMKSQIVFFASLFFLLHINFAEASNEDTPPKQQHLLKVMDLPLPNDTIVCGNLLLDATNINAISYVWSTGDTTASILVDTTGMYTVQVFDGSNTQTDSIFVSVVPLPPDPNLTDTTICGAGNISLPANTTADIIRWYDSGNNLLFTGPIYTPNVTGTTTFSVEATNQLRFSVGRPNIPTLTNAFTNFNVNALFDVFETLVLDSVAMYASSNNTNFVIELKNAANTVIASKNINISQANTKVFVDLGFTITPGTGYKLGFRSLSGGQLGRGGNQNNNTYPAAVSLTGNSLGNTTQYYFYDWHFSKEFCTSAQIPITVSVATVPTLNLNSDTLICGTASILLDAGNIGSNYIWSTSETTQQILANTSGVYTVTVTNTNNCSVTDSAIIDIIPLASNPITTDTTICGAGTVSLSAQHTGDRLNWYDAPTQTNLLFSGNTYTPNITTNTTYYVSSVNTLSRSVGQNKVGSLNGSFNNFPTQMIFDLIEPITLDSVAVYASAPNTSFTAIVKDNTGTTIASKSVSVANDSVKYFIDLGFALPPGTDYTLEFANLQGGQLARGNGGNFPNTYPGIISITGNSFGNTAQYFFYDWRFTYNACESGIVPLNVTVAPTPSVDLGADTLICGASYTLDATNPGSTYLWSTTETTQTIIPTTTDTYSVTVTNPQGCTDTDDVTITVVPQPSTPILTDTTVCGPQSVSLSAATDAAKVNWYDAPTNGNLLFSGNPYTPTVNSTTTYYAQGQNSLTGNVGVANLGSLAGVFANLNVRTRFDVEQALILDSIAVYSNTAPLTFIVEIRDGSGSFVTSRLVTVTDDSTKFFIPLDIPLNPGTGYTIGYTNLSGGLLGRGTLANYPNADPGIISITGNTFNNNTAYYFYDWHYSIPACNTNLEPVTVTVSPTPNVNLPADTILCGQSNFLLDAGNPGSTYAWNTGQTTQTLLVDSTHTYKVTVTNTSNCAESDSILVSFFDIPSDPITEDTTLCGPRVVSLTATTDAAQLYWYDDSTAVYPIHIGNTYSPNINASTTLFAQGVNALTGTVGRNSLANLTNAFSSFPATTFFDVEKSIVLDSVAVYAKNSPVNFTVNLKSSNNTILATKSFTITQDSVKTFIDLGFLVDPGTGYKLELNGPFGGELARGGTVNPIRYPGIIEITGNSVGNTAQYFFYDWHFTHQACTSNRVPLDITVAPVPIVDLGVDTLLCGGTGYSLDAGNAGSSFLWSTGDITQTLSIDSTDTYSVTVTNAFGCEGTDNVLIGIIPTPNSPVVQDTTICGVQTLDLTFPTSGDEVLYWYEDAADITPIFIGNVYQNLLADTTTFFIEAVNPLEATVGWPELSTLTNAFFNFPVRTFFDIYEPIIIDSVAVYSSTINTNFDLVISDNSGTPIYTQAVSVNQASTKTYVPLGVILPPGTGYRMEAMNISGGQMARGGTMTPASIPDVMMITGNSVGNNTQYSFFDWNIRAAACVSSRQSYTINVAPIPQVDLGNDTLFCGITSYLLDAGTDGAAYAWNTGTFNQTYNVVSSGTYAVDVTNFAGCLQSDSIRLVLQSIPSDPLTSDTTICGAGQVTLSASTDGETNYWYTNSNANHPVFVGADFSPNVSTNTTFYTEGVNQIEEQLGLGSLNNLNNAFINFNVGTRFNVYQSVVLDSVAVYTDQVGTNFTINLKNSSGTIIDQRAITLTTDSTKEFVPLGFNIPPGNNYRLDISNLSGGQLARNGTIPASVIPDVMELTTTTLNNTVHYFFYDWRISYKGCTSNRDSIQVTVAPLPQVNIGPDTTLCGSGIYSLNAGNSGASFNWSNGAITQSITVNTSDVYTVVVTSVNGCSNTDSALVNILPIPLAPTVSDTAVCAADAYQLTANSPADLVCWYDSIVDGNLLHIGHQYTADLTTSSTLYVESVNSLSGRVGRLNVPSLTGAFVNFNVSTYFHTNEAIVLDSVAVYTDNFPVDLTINLRDSLTNDIIASSSYTVMTDSAKVFVPLGFAVPEGGYYLELDEISGGNIARGGSAGYPNNFSDVVTLTRNSLNNTTNYLFYDWHFRYKGCESNRVPMNVTVSPSPVVELGNDTLLCGQGSFTLNAQNPGALYFWSTQENTQTITPDTTGVYSVVVTNDFGCAQTDDILLSFIEAPNNPIISDTNLCGPGPVTLTAQGNATTYFWYDDPISGTLLHTGANYTINAQSDTTFYVESVNRSTGTIGLEEPPTLVNAFADFNAGMIFDVEQEITLDSVAFYTTNSLISFTVRLRDSLGAVLFVQAYSLQVIPGAKTFLPLGLVIPPGRDYVLEARSIGTGGLARGGDLDFPENLRTVMSLTGNSLGSDIEYYFYDWHVSYKGCESNRIPVDVTLEIPLDIPDEIYSCNTTVLDAGSLPGLTYQWSTGATTSGIFVNESGTYSVNISNGNCAIDDSTLVTIPVLNLGNNGTLCGNVLDAGFPGGTYEWSTAETTQTITVMTPGTYWVTVEEPLGCTLTDTIVVNSFETPPDVNIGDDFFSCNPTVLDAGFPGYSYDWSTGETTQTITVNASGSYCVTVTSANGCTGTDCVNASIPQVPNAAFNYSTNGLIVSFNNISDFGTYSWTFGDGDTSTDRDPIHTYTAGGTYTVTLIVTGDCGTDTMTQTIVLTNSIDPTAWDNQHIKVFPNPSTGTFFIELEGDALQEVIRLQVFDLRGRMVHNEQFFKQRSGSIQHELKLNSLVPDIYFLQLQTEDDFIRHKIIIR